MTRHCCHDESSDSSITSDRRQSSSASTTDDGYDASAIIEAYNQKYDNVVSAPPNASLAYEPKRQFTPYISLGPVIGLVSETTARILIETSADVDVKAFVTDRDGVQHGCALFCPKKTPTVFIFEELKPGTVYKVSFDQPVPGLVKSSFQTLNSRWGSSISPARIATVSHNDMTMMRDKISERNDLWKALYYENEKQKINYLLHLGSTVYIDSNEYVETREGRYPTENNTSVFLEALDLVEGIEPRFLHELETRVCELFRNQYRDTWNIPTIRHCLANIPNLMLPGEMELGTYVEDERDQGRAFVHQCAYRVYNEYCRSLFENVNEYTTITSIKIDQAYHFHAFGDIGIVMLDTRAYPLHHNSTKPTETPFMGHRQWSDIDFALSDHGYLSLCRTLLICTTQPIVQASESKWLSASTEEQMQLLNTWCSPDGFDEASLLLSKLFDWKNKRPGDRNVVLLAGSPSSAGITNITDVRYEKGHNTITQLTAGNIAGSASGKLTRLCCGAHSGIGVYHSFSHRSVYDARALGLATIIHDRDYDGAEVHLKNMVAKADKIMMK